MASIPPGGNGPPGDGPRGRGRAILMRSMQLQQQQRPGQTSDGRTTSPPTTSTRSSPSTVTATPRTTPATRTPPTTATGSSSDRATAASPTPAFAQGAGAAGPRTGPAGRSRGLVDMMSRLRAAGHDPKPSRGVVSVTHGVTHPTGPQVVSVDPTTGRPLGQGDGGKAFAPIRAPMSPVPRGAVSSPTPPTRGTPSPVPPSAISGRPPSRGAVSPPPQVPPAGPGRPLSPAQQAAIARGRSSTPPTAGSLLGSGSRPTPTTPSPPPTASGTSTTTPPIVKRGKEGKKVPTTCNYVKLDIKPGGGMFEYEVKFNPPVDSLRDKRAMLLDQQRAIIGSATNFNGVTLHLPTKLPQEQTICKAALRDKPYKVGIFYKKRRHYSDKEVILFLNNLFRRVMHILKMVNVKGHMYSPNLSVSVEQHRLEIWPGFITAIDEYEGGIQMLCDASFRVLRTETALDVIRALPREENFRDRVVKELLKSVVLTRYNNKTYIVDDIDFTMNPLSTFRLTKADREITFIDYYRDK